MEYYKKESSEVLENLQSSPEGLNNAQAEKRLQEYGPNKLDTEVKIEKWKIFLEQFKSFIIYILLIAVVLSLLFKEFTDAILILIILFVNAFIGYKQEISAAKSLSALKKLSVVKAKVFRNKELTLLSSEELVPGDCILLEAGDKVPADSRILQCSNLSIEEAALTGESLPVQKTSETLQKDAQIAEQHNMLFSSTNVTNGTAKAVVVSTGMKTEIGKITKLIKEAEDEQTPLQKRLDSFGKKLSYAVIVVCLFIFAAILFSDKMAGGEMSLLQATGAALAVAVALAVAAVPEGLPAVVTIALSVGVKRLLHKKALVRKLSSVETLGSCDVICTDKTGTLTQNEMTVQAAWTLDNEAKIDGVGYHPQGTVQGKVHPLLFTIGLHCNNAKLEKEKMWRVIGDPTEGALIVSAKKALSSEQDYKRLAENPFDSDRKRMSVLVEQKGKKDLFCKGAPDTILAVCTHAIHKGKKVPLTKELKKEIMQQNDKYASQALRVLAFAYKEHVTEKTFKEKELTFVGLQAMKDPARPDVIESIAKTKKAGIRVIMITGDYKETARAIGQEVGIEGEVITGEELEKMTEEDLTKALEGNTRIFARVIPEHKQRIVAALQKKGHVVAMTGDGVNDAPALKKADIGVAVGSGTDVAKEAADFVLLDDSFTHIVDAIEEGRGIYENIQKTIMHLLSGNLSEVLIIFVAVLFGLSHENLPLTAVMLLWINLVTDGTPAVALSVDPYGRKIMEKKPRPSSEGILPKPYLFLITFLAVVSTIITLSFFSFYGGFSEHHESIQIAQTMVFTFLIISEMILLLLIRKQFDIKMLTNTWLWVSIGLSFVLQAVLLYTPLNNVFKITPLTFSQILFLGAGAIALYLSYVIYSFVEKRVTKKTVV